MGPWLAWGDEMSRSEFSVKTRKAAWARAGGICECGCGQPFDDHPKNHPHYDHVLPDFLGGVNDLENCAVIRVCCHQVKTYGKDMPMIIKARRADKARTGTQRRKALIAGSKGSGYRRKMDGSVVRVRE